MPDRNMKPYLMFIAMLLAFCASIAIANDTPANLAGAIVVDAAKAKALMESGAVMVDARVAIEYAESHIKGAQSVPYKEKSEKAVNFDPSVDSFDLSKLPANKGATIIFSCNGADCWKSYKAAQLAIKAGYKAVYWLRGGLPEWKAKGFPIE